MCLSNGKCLKILIICFFTFQFAYGQVFQKYNTELGLPYNEVSKVCQDEEGLLYVGTSTGLNVMGGSWLKQYNSSNTPGFNNVVVDILPIHNNMLLAGTENNGLFLLKKELSKVVRLHVRCNNSSNLILPIRTLHQDNVGQIWIGTRDRGLFKFHIDSVQTSSMESFVHVTHYSAFDHITISDITSWKNNLWVGTLGEGVYALETNSVQGVLPSKYGFQLKNKNIWNIEVFNDSLFIGTEDGLSVVDLYSEKQNSLLQSNAGNSGKPIIVRSISKDCKGNFWIGSQESGLFKLWNSKGNWEVQQFTSTPNNILGLNTNKILTTYVDRHDNIWIGTWDGGILRYSEKDGGIKNIRNHQKASVNSENMTKCFVTKDQDSYWIGTYGNGICEYHNSSESFFERIETEGNNSVSSLYHDKEKGLLLAGTWGFGLKIYDSKTLQPKYIDVLNHPKLKNDRIYSIFKDKHGIYWLATIKHGLFSLKIDSGDDELKEIDFYKFVGNPSGKDAEFRQILKGYRENTLIIIKHDYGIYEIETDSDGNVLYVEDLLRNTNLRKEYHINFLKCGFFDRNNTLLVGTSNGILQMKSDSEKPEVILVNENIVAHDIIEDSEGKLWIASYAGGLVKYSPKEKELKKYLSTSIFFKLHYKSETDILLAASHSGLYQFNTSLSEQDSFYPEIYFNGLNISNQAISPGYEIDKRIIIPKHINYINEFKLPYSHNSFSLYINALSYSFPEQNNIMYRLDGLEEDWHNEKLARVKANYRNLPPGEYTLQVKVSNKDNVWNPETRTIQIEILPPWWRTSLAHALYIFLSLSVIFLVIILIRKRNLAIQERKIRDITSEKEEDLNEQKLRFFTNISHEIRTPLTLILGPLEDILLADKPGTWINKQHRVMHKNASLLLRLINEILDFRKLENQMLTLSYSSIDLSSFARELVGQFESIAKQKGIELYIKESIETKQISADRDKLEKVILNLLSNAINHTQKGGYVEITLGMKEGMFQIRVKDNGEGISAEDLPYIFKRFYQSNSKSGMGTGIGLALAQKIVELHKGTIEVESEKGVGTTFTIELPMGPPVEAISSKEEVEVDQQPEELHVPVIQETIKVKQNIDKSNKLEILAVDDNADIREYLYDNLSDLYSVHMAESGEAGIEMARKIIPSLIICDIMMDGMDGIEVCETLKQDIDTSHIPFVLLTSKSSEDSTVEGFAKGADDYITKPFSSRVLKTRVQNLIAQRKHLQKKYSLLDIPDSKPYKSLDEELITKVVTYIEENLSNTDLNVESIAKSVELTHDQYYRKMKNITGLTANKFTRKVRLNKAKALLLERQHNVSEIMYRVGFASPSYFTRSFKEEFGCTPTEYLEQEKTILNK